MTKLIMIAEQGAGNDCETVDKLSPQLQSMTMNTAYRLFPHTWNVAFQVQSVFGI